MLGILHNRGVEIRSAGGNELDAATLYRILALRSAVFVVEQDCVYLDPDGRDLEPSAVQVWAERDGEVVATLRVLDEPNGAARIGRVATAPDERGAGLAGQLLRHALTMVDGRPVELHAQSHLARWYETFGFVRDGADYLDDGIPHTPMRLA